MKIAHWYYNKNKLLFVAKVYHYPEDLPVNLAPERAASEDLDGFCIRMLGVYSPLCGLPIAGLLLGRKESNEFLHTLHREFLSVDVFFVPSRESYVGLLPLDRTWMKPFSEDWDKPE